MTTMDQAKEIIMQQNAELERIASEGLLQATVLKKEGDKFWIVATQGQTFRVADPVKLKIKKGDVVFLHIKTHQIVEKAASNIQTGSTYIIASLINGGAEIEVAGESRIVAIPEGLKLKAGDRVFLDPSQNIICGNLGPSNRQFSVESKINVTWDDIGGLEEAKADMIEAIELPHKNWDIFKFYNKKPSKGVLLYGPPGNGKTMLGKAAATSLAKIYGKERTGSFMYVKGPEILNKYVGESESNVRALFARAKRHKDEHGYPAVIFIDEADALLAKRGGEQTNGSSWMSNTLVPMFLAEMDGIEESSAVVILATNRPDVLDPAIVRHGRIDRKIKVTRPLAKDAEKIVLLNLSKAPTVKGTKHADLAKLAVSELYSPRRVIYTIETESGSKSLLLSHMISGAMLAAVADHALSLAMRRDMDKGTRSGLTKEDITGAVDVIDRQCRDIDHTDIIQDFAESVGEEITNILKAA